MATTLDYYQRIIKTMPTARTIPHFLFVGTRWLAGNPELGVNTLPTFTYGPLETSGYASYDFFAVDDFYIIHKQNCDSSLLKICKDSKPDLLVLVWWPGAPDHLNPSLETLYIIRATYGIPIVAMWYDTWAEWIVEIAERLLPFVDLAVVSDSISHFYNSLTPHKYVNMLPPFDQRIFYDPQIARDVDVSFNGGVNPYPDRVSGLNTLRDNGILVMKSGGQLEAPLPLEEFARIYMRSKITLNFSRSGEKLTMKGRTIEALLCGALLIESENPETPKWFEPMVDYVPFANENELVDKVRYYLERPDERQEIALRGKIKAQKLADGLTYWKSIYERVSNCPSFNNEDSLINLITCEIEKGHVTRAQHYLEILTPDLHKLASQKNEAVKELENRAHPLISIITICRNSEKTIRRCIESVLAQTYPHFEYIIQDGVSTDRTLDIIKGYDDPRIKLISEPDSGGSHAYFKALCRCSGDIITLCWSDEELLPHAIQWGVENMAQHPEVVGIYGDVYSTDIHGKIDENSQPAPAWDLEKFLCWEMMANYCASFMRYKALQDSGFFEFTSSFIDAGKCSLEDANCIMYDYFALPALIHPILHVPGYVGKFSVHKEQLSSTPKVIFGMIPGLLRSIDNICDSPLADKGIKAIKAIKSRAYAGIHLAMINTLLVNAKSYEDAKTMLRSALQHEPDIAVLEKVCRESCDHLVNIEEFSHALEFLSIIEQSGYSFPDFGYFQALTYLESGLFDKAQESVKKELLVARGNSKIQVLDTKLRDHMNMQQLLENELSELHQGPQKQFISQLLYFTSLAEHKTLKRLGQILNGGISAQSFIDAANILEKSVRAPGFLIAVRNNAPAACPLIEKTLTAYLCLAVEHSAGELAKRITEVLAEYYSETD
jgi:tetratricopeptide (TPR) repeat protein